jgi:hypothetical protein
MVTDLQHIGPNLLGEEFFRVRGHVTIAQFLHMIRACVGRSALDLFNVCQSPDDSCVYEIEEI